MGCVASVAFLFLFSGAFRKFRYDLIVYVKHLKTETEFEQNMIFPNMVIYEQFFG